MLLWLSLANDSGTTNMLIVIIKGARQRSENDNNETRTFNMRPPFDCTFFKLVLTKYLI